MRLTPIALVTSIAALGAVAFATGGGDCSLAGFDERAWARLSSIRPPPDGAPPTPRQRLADALIECESFEGATRTEVRHVLGRPDNYVVHDPGVERGAWSYNLGTERGFFGIDDEHLLVRFDPSRRVRSLELVTD